jgi:hypothetical protein
VKPRAYSRRAEQKNFLSLFEEKIGGTQMQNCKQSLSLVWRALASGGAGGSIGQKFLIK